MPWRNTLADLTLGRAGIARIRIAPGTSIPAALIDIPALTALFARIGQPDTKEVKSVMEVRQGIMSLLSMDIIRIEPTLSLLVIAFRFIAMFRESSFLTTAITVAETVASPRFRKGI